jgi:putative ABC transport system permease protein
LIHQKRAELTRLGKLYSAGQVILLIRTLILRPLGRDWLRTGLTLTAVALGVAVVIGIELAGDAASGSFQSSLTTIVGKTDLQISANGGVDERWMGALPALPLNAVFSPVLEREVRIEKRGMAALFGVDAIALGDQDVVVSSALARRLGSHKGDLLKLDIGTFRIESIVDSTGDAEFLAMDIAAAQYALHAYGKLDRIEVAVSPREDFGKVERAIREVLPRGYLIDKPGARSNENQRMLRAFRWNLRVLSYISLVVGAILIYNTISISVVRRRAEIGILRALGAARTAIFAMFMVEALMFGIVGSALGILLGRLMAEGLVGLISATVNSLYASSRPASIELTWQTAAMATASGLIVALAAAFGPALEAMKVTPREAMARGSGERRAAQRTGRFLGFSLVLAVCAYVAAQQGPVNGSPIFGYVSVLLAIGAAALVAPALTLGTITAGKGIIRRTLGVGGLIAAQGLTGSLGRTSVVVAALSTAIAMMASVGIMVGSFRETVISWLDTQLRADIYIRASAPAPPGIFPPISPEVAERLRRVAGVEAIDVLSGMEIRYGGARAGLGGEDPDVLYRYGRLKFLPGEDRDNVIRSLKGQNRAAVTQAFANKYHLQVGDRLVLPLGDQRPAFTIAGIYYDYASERGFVLIDRAVLLKYLPDQPPTNLAVYLRPGADRESALRMVRDSIAEFGVNAAPNEVLRTEAVKIFDRTFAVTWALEGVAILVAMLGAANSLLAMVLDRRREFGLLQYLGAATAQIRRTVLVEAALVGMLANILGAALGFALSLVLIYVINVQSFGWSIQFHPPVFLLSAALLLVWCVTIVAGIYPALVATRLNPMDVIHTE